MSKRTLEKDITQEELPRERYLYVGNYTSWDGEEAVKRTILSFTDLALGAHFHKMLSLCDRGDIVAEILSNLSLPYEKRRTFDGEDDDNETKLDEKTRQIIDAVGPECVEKQKVGQDEFGAIKNGFYYFV